MKNLLAFITILAFCSFAQQHNCGNISLIFNGEKIDLPIENISLNKDDSIVQQFVSLSIGLKKLSPEPDAETFKGTKINMKTMNNSSDSRKELSIWFDDNDLENNEQSETAHYAVYKNGEWVSWEINSVSFKLDITKFEYISSSLHISGEFEGTFKSNSAPKGQFAKIEEGKFELIL